jgi:hypothetical protein
LSEVFLKVEVYPTNFKNPKKQYVSGIYVDSTRLTNYSFPMNDGRGGMFVSVRDANVTSLVNRGVNNGSFTVKVTATRSVNTYPYRGYLLYVRYSVYSTRMPTGQPTSQPSGQPSGQPTTTPSGRPTGTPSTQPSSTPSRTPSSRPSNTPSIMPTALPSSHPTYRPSVNPTTMPSSSYPSSFPSFEDTNAPYTFVGGNISEITGIDWSVGTNWDRHSAPQENSSVILSMENNRKIYVSENITIRNLYITGDGTGTLILLENVILTVNEKFQIFHGIIKGVKQNFGSFFGSNSTLPMIIISKEGILSGDEKIVLESVHIQNNGHLVIEPGNIVMSNCVIESSEGSEIIFLTEENTKNVLRNNIAYENFECFENSRLDQKIILNDILPRGRALFDMTVPNGVLVTATGETKKEFFPLQILNNKIALQYYGNLSNSNQTIYTDIVQSTDIEECCLLCLESDRCFSFDFNIFLGDCSISPFSAGDTGGLARNAHGWSHHARKSVTSPPNSVLRINGILTVFGSGILDIYIDIEFGTKSFFSSLDIASINFHSNVRTSHSFQAELCGGRLTFAASDSGFGFGSISGSEFSGPRSIGDGLTLNYSASILFKDCSNDDISISTPIPEIIFRGGRHNIYGQINGNVSIIVQNGSVVTFFQNSTNLLNFTTVLIENSSIASIVPVDKYSNRLSSENFSFIISMENLTIRENGKLLLQSMKNILNVKRLEIGPTGVLSGYDLYIIWLTEF